MNIKKVDISVAKLHNSGNSFIVCENIFNSDGDAAIKLCNHHYGIGSDGMVLVIKCPNPDEYRLVFVNNNGSYFKMCFNGTLCAILYIISKYKVPPRTLFMPDGLAILSNYGEHEISLIFERPESNYFFEEIKVNNIPAICYWVPYADCHKIILMNNSDFFYDMDFTTWAQMLRSPDSFFSDGANVHFVFVTDERIYIRHYEKNIENETLSCGSGCVAAAIVLENINLLVFTSPGGVLNLIKDNSKWHLSGSPQYIGDCVIAE